MLTYCGLRRRKVEIRGNVPTFTLRETSGKPFRENYPQYTQLCSNHDLIVIDSLVYCDSSTLAHVATKEALPVACRGVLPV
ncbi:unnamed protein product [Timema podura]|uniref:Uncharacterized protein n=1 Tax=Timema podura TaxID=61482 RepID=A0ABN7PHB4_TIMPD|nr:unnamed protein product [Timema podura]